LRPWIPCPESERPSTGVGKRRKSVSKNSGPILNLFSPKRDLFHGHCHIESLLLVSRIASRFLTTRFYCGLIRAASCSTELTPPTDFIRKIQKQLWFNLRGR